MSSAISNAVSGLAAAGKRLEVAAQNIANQNSSSSKIDGVDTKQPYLPQDIVQISEAGGGVRAETRTAPNPVAKIYNPENADANEDGTVDVPNVDVATQLVNQKIASYDFKANLKTIEVQRNLDQSLFDILS